MRRFIIGGGITGLIISHCSSLRGIESMIFTVDIGGQLGKSFSLGPRILHENKNTREFLKTLKINEEPRTFRVGYCKGDAFTEGRVEMLEDVSEEDSREYFEKTRGVAGNSKTALSEGKKIIVGWDMNEIQLVERLKQKCENRIIKSTIGGATDQILKYGKESFDEVIWTAKLENLMKLLELKPPKSMRLKNEMFYFLPESAEKELAERGIVFDGVDYIYNVSKSSPEKRYTRAEKGFVIETLEEVKELERYGKLKKGVIIEEELKWREIEGIKLAGRYAEMNHAVKADRIIERYF